MDATLVARRLGADPRTIRRAVERGAVKAHRPSQRRLDIDDAELGYLDANWRLLFTLQALLRTEPNVAAAVLFGSLARGDGAASSDIDLLVDLRRDSATDAEALAGRLAGRLGRDVHITRASSAAHAPGLLAEARADGRPLVDRNGYWRRLQRRRLPRAA